MLRLLRACALVFLPATVCAQPLLRLVAPTAHQGSVGAVAIAPGGELAATGGSDQRIHLWHLPGARQWRTLDGHAGAVGTIAALAFSPDGTMLASGDGAGGVRVWRVADGAMLCALGNPNDRPDSILAGGQNTRRIGWSGAGELWAVGHYGIARRWRVQGCVESARLDVHNGAVRDAVPVRDGWWVASGSDLVVSDGAGKARAKHALGADALRFLDAPVAGERPWLHLEDGAMLALEADGRPAAREVDASQPRAVARVPGGWVSADDMTVTRGREVRTLQSLAGAAPGAATLAVSRSEVAALGELVVMASGDGIVALDARSGRLHAHITAPRGVYARHVAVSPDGRWLVQAGISAPVIWDLASGRAAGTLTLPVRGTSVEALAFASPSGLLILDYDSGKRLATLRRFDLAEGRFGASRSLGSEASALVVAPAGDRVYVARGDGVDILAIDDLSPLGRLPLQSKARAMQLSIDGQGRTLLARHANGIELLPLAGGTPRALDKPALGSFSLGAAELSADGSLFWVALGDHVSAFPVEGGEARWRVPAPVPYGSVLRRSPDGRRVALVGASVTLYDAADGRTSGHANALSLEDAAWLDGTSLISLGTDGSLRVWRDPAGALLEARVLARPPGGDCFDPGLCTATLPWLVSTADGRFDTGDFAALDGLAWYRAARPFEALPFELFARRGFEPRLLPRTLAGGLPAAREAPPARFDPPRVRVAAVGPSTADPASLRVEIDVEARGGGLASVALLRDGVRVARVSGDALPGGGARRGGRIVVDPVRFPATAYAPLRFTAIAYDTEGLQASAAIEHRPPFDAKRVSEMPLPTHFLVTIGVNRHDNAAFDLAYAANDARRIGERLAQTFEGARGAGRVVRATLLADDAARLATKARIREALQVLSGAVPASTDPALAGLRRAGPDDTVVISFAGHGFNGDGGEFYLVPSDTGPGRDQRITPELQQRSIASRELAEWLDGLDAGRAVLVLDACHSAAAVGVRDFVPGPMDSRGLGQLAYDKGLAVLVATQADDVALESGRLQQGLLSYALVAEGLEKGEADFAPRDGRLGLIEWLSFAVGRVPVLAREVRAGRLPLAPGARALARLSSSPAAPAAAPLPAQTPALFYFARGRADPTLARVPPR